MTKPPLPPLSFDERGLVPVVTQDATSGEVLMVAYANQEAIDKTLASGEAHYYSRSRGELWHKGATSGNVQKVREVRVDCDADTLLYRVDSAGPACHTGERSCFYRAKPLQDDTTPTMGEMMGLLERVVNERLEHLPAGSYVTKMHDRGLGYISQKVVEEAGETIVAALQNQQSDLVGEASDLLFHLVVLLRESGVTLTDVAAKLAERHQEKTQQE
ncbi:MAG: bifunctional phosphoribosyl-AMP cyclohydrolase/phosphoribosyl-ATP diphosphatase HisIE [Trueperaceae bacterium]|nr:bifunctional phosphoribosyl-AMP cyclohydrolase/phosphoribosyl-ATP diphosphatase HisIE [Trueperaceae bacterium]